MREFDLIALIRARAARVSEPASGVVLGIGDDAAVLRTRPGWDLVVTTDTLNEGVHFSAAAAPADIGWKSLAVNLSDLAAMGAAPCWCTLSLSLPRTDAAWAEAFLDGFLALAGQAGIALVGGDTTRGPLSVSVTAIGQVEAGTALRRDGARPGDDVWVTGTLGDAAAGLALHGESAASSPAAALLARLHRPEPRLAMGRHLAGLAHACVDVSDGLVADLGHICGAGGVGAEIHAVALPASPALRFAVAGDAARLALQATGGDDYELCFAAPVAVRERILAAADVAGMPVTRIGRIVAQAGVRVIDRGGRALPLSGTGYEHFRDPAV